MRDLLEDITVGGPLVDMRLPETWVVHLIGDDVTTLGQLAVLMKCSPIEVFVQLVRNARPSPNGQGYEVPCSGCGLPFQSPRRPLPGKKHWCENCRKTGEPGADRARRYRDRKAAAQGGQ